MTNKSVPTRTNITMTELAKLELEAGQSVESNGYHTTIRVLTRSQAQCLTNKLNKLCVINRHNESFNVVARYKKGLRSTFWYVRSTLEPVAK